MLRRLAFLVLLAGLSTGAVRGSGMEIAFEHDGDPVYQVIPAGQTPAIDEPRFLARKAGDAQMAPEEPVFGVKLGEEARAYSLWQLDRHEIVNDSMEGVAFAATW